MSIPYFDAHCDTAVPVHFLGGSLLKNAFHLDLERLSAYAPRAQVFALCVNHGEDMEAATEAVLDTLLAEFSRHSDRVRLCRSAADIRTAAREGKCAALISVEGMEKLGCSMEKLRAAYEKGVRIVHLTWNHDNALSGAAMDSGAGLTAEGRAFVPAAQRMGAVLDLSHLSERGFWDVLERIEKPVLAGHSNARALCDVPRNLTDAQFRALVQCSGAVGLNLYPPFLGEKADVESVLRHAEHFLALGGEKTLCLGGDLDGVDCLPEGITGVESMETLYIAMARRFGEKTAEDIFYNNLKNFMERVL